MLGDMIRVFGDNWEPVGGVVIPQPSNSPIRRKNRVRIHIEVEGDSIEEGKVLTIDTEWLELNQPEQLKFIIYEKWPELLRVPNRDDIRVPPSGDRRVQLNLDLAHLAGDSKDGKIYTMTLKEKP